MPGTPRKAWVYLLLSVIGFGYFAVWQSGWRDLGRLAMAGNLGETEFKQALPLLTTQLKLARVDLFYFYPIHVDPVDVIREMNFQFILHMRIGIIVGVTALAGFFNGWRVKKQCRRILLGVQMLLIILTLWQTGLVANAVLTTPRFAPLPVYSTVENILYKTVYFGDAKYRNFALPRRNEGQVIQKDGTDMHLILSGTGYFKIGNIIVTPNDVRDVLQAVSDRYETAKIFLWVEDQMPDEWMMDKIRKYKDEFPDAEWFWVVEADSLVEGRPNILALPFNEF